ncbi:hypothetical protein HGRIS_009204 [Hohenbuehelia grisea]|uniref:Uncharacterized protein n=1 Tax=Hohenbuehelia grisea TaxID=104357 RepID=A0ABR3J0E6_9AGAR
MIPTLRVCSSRVHQPLIKFLGRRSWPSTPESPHAHAFAPGGTMPRSTSSAQSSSPTNSATKSSGKPVYAEFWEAPERFWRPRVRELPEWEIEAVLTGGASNVQ